MYGMTTLAPSINFTVDGFGFCWFSGGVCLVERTVLGSECLVGLMRLERTGTISKLSSKSQTSYSSETSSCHYH